MCVGTCTCTMVSMWRPEDNLEESVFSSHLQVGSRGWTQAVQFVRTVFYLLSHHLTGLWSNAFTVSVDKIMKLCFSLLRFIHFETVYQLCISEIYYTAIMYNLPKYACVCHSFVSVAIIKYSGRSGRGRKVYLVHNSRLPQERSQVIETEHS